MAKVRRAKVLSPGANSGNVLAQLRALAIAVAPVAEQDGEQTIPRKNN